jgi:hypothetical protein
VATKYQEYFQRMLQENKSLFDEFKNIHDRYGLEEEKLQKEFNEIGSKVQTVIRNWEDKLCGRSEGSGYASYSGNLAQKFQDEVRKVFPLIDNIGIIRETPATAPVQEESEEFSLKKIDL